MAKFPALLYSIEDQPSENISEEIAFCCGIPEHSDAKCNLEINGDDNDGNPEHCSKNEPSNDDKLTPANQINLLLNESFGTKYKLSQILKLLESTTGCERIDLMRRLITDMWGDWRHNKLLETHDPSDDKISSLLCDLHLDTIFGGLDDRYFIFNNKMVPPTYSANLIKNCGYFYYTDSFSIIEYMNNQGLLLQCQSTA